MEKINNITTIKARRNLRDFIRLVLAFFACLMLLAVYQNSVLFSNGVLDSIFNRSLLLQWVNHAGFTALAGLFLSFIYNFLERRKYGSGFSIMYAIFTLLLIAEGLLIRFFTTKYEPLELGYIAATEARDYWLPAIALLGISVILLWTFYKLMARVYQHISKMYPFTLVLFSFFLASQWADKKPVNENKTQHLLAGATSNLLEVNTYKGDAEFPLLRTYLPDNSLVPYFKMPEDKPNVVIVMIDGLGSDFVGEDARYPGFTPFLDSLRKKSLYWTNFLSNTGISSAAMPSLTGSLPFGTKGFTHNKQYVNRQTLFTLLKKNGYTTTFHYGGNTALEHWDRFLSEEQLDFVYDDKGFAASFTKQDTDAAGISLGYPDKALFGRWSQNRAENTPRLECFITLSSKAPFLIPDEGFYTARVQELVSGSHWDSRETRLIQKNDEKFASILYADGALRHFMESYSSRPEYGQTIFLITGTHNMAELPQESAIDRYRVPMLIYSPLLRAPATIKNVASHADVVPSLVGLLEHSYPLQVPAAVAWMGEGLIQAKEAGPRHIPFLRHENNIQDFLLGDYFLSDGELFRLDDQLRLREADLPKAAEEIQAQFRFFKSANNYVTRQNKLVPETLAPGGNTEAVTDKQELVWIQSVFNGSNYDNAYDTARKLALDGNTDRALLLCRHILDKVPGHADTEILMGRIYGWQDEHQKAADILQAVIRKYPVYADGYLALLDVYYWAGDFERALGLQPVIRKNNLKNLEIEQKIKRAQDQKIRSLQEELIKTNQAQAAVSTEHLQ